MDRMRADYLTMRKHWQADGWTDEELAEADRGVRRAVDKGEQTMIESWADWLAGLAADVRGAGR